MTRSAVTSLFRSDATGALLVMAHPDRSAAKCALVEITAIQPRSVLTGLTGFTGFCGPNLVNRFNPVKEVWEGSPNQPLEPMTRSAVTSIFQVERLWRAPRHGSPLPLCGVGNRARPVKTKSKSPNTERCALCDCKLHRGKDGHGLVLSANEKAEPCRGGPPMMLDWNKPLTGAPRHWLQRPGSAILSKPL